MNTDMPRSHCSLLASLYSGPDSCLPGQSALGLSHPAVVVGRDRR